jgi:8-oxo-dGTP diphosphatase
MPETPHLTTDLIIRIAGESDRVVLVERRNPPPGWALPGGFVDLGETVAEGARREAREETGLVVTLVTLLGVYSGPARDPRGHTVGLVYVADANGVPEAGDDAAKARGWSLDALPPLAFDHEVILADYMRWLATGSRAPLTR